MSKLAMARAILTHLPFTDRLRVYDIYLGTDSVLHEVETENHTIVARSVSGFNALPFWMIDPTPELPWPHDCLYLVGYWGFSAHRLREKPTDRYTLKEDHTIIRHMRRAMRTAVVNRQIAASPLVEHLKPSAYEIAKASGVSQSLINKWIDYGPQALSDQAKRLLAEALQVAPEDLK
jgi:hypothetical protein